MERVGKTLAGELERLGPQAGAGPLLDAWPDSVGAGIAAHAWPARLARDGTLHVATSSSVWAFELTQLAPTLLARLQERLGDGAPARLRFAAGRVPEPGPATPPEDAPVPLSPGAAEVAQAQRLAERIDDDELRSIVARAAAASLARGGSDR